MGRECLEWSPQDEYRAVQNSSFHFSVATFDFLNSIRNRTDAPGQEYTMCDEIAGTIKALANSAKCSFQFVLAKVGGHKLKDGTFNGAMGLLANKTVDAVFAQTAITGPRHEIAEPTSFLQAYNFLSLLSRPKIISNTFEVLFAFRQFVWVMILVWLAFTTFANILHRRLVMKAQLNVFTTLVYHLAAMLQQAIPTKESSLYLNTLFTAWCSLTFILGILFNSGMSASFSAHRMKGFDTIEQVIAERELFPLVEKTSFAYNFIIKDQFPPERLAKMTKKDVVQKILTGKYIYVGDEIDVDLMMKANPNLPLYKGRQPKYLGIASIVLRRDLEVDIKKRIKKVIAWLYETGLIGYWDFCNWLALRHAAFDKRDAIERQQFRASRYYQITFDDVIIVGELFLYGMSLGAMALICENCLFALSRIFCKKPVIKSKRFCYRSSKLKEVFGRQHLKVNENLKISVFKKYY